MAAVIIVTYNSEAVIDRCLDAVASSTEPTDVVVVDNASTDGTRARIANHPDVRLVESTRNLGYAVAANLGAEHTPAETLVFLNPDTAVSRDAIPRLLGRLAHDPDFGAAGPVSNTVGGGQSIVNWLDDTLCVHSFDPERREEIAATLAVRHRQQVAASRFLSGFCIAITRRQFDALGGMDPELVLGLDDFDWSWRLSLAQKRLIIVPEAFVYHQGQASYSAAPSEAVRRMHERSNAVFSKKLIDYYGGADRVPPSNELFGTDMFRLWDFERDTSAG